MLILLILWATTYMIALSVGTSVIRICTRGSSPQSLLDPTQRFLVGLAIITSLANYWSIGLPLTPLFFAILLPFVIHGLSIYYKSRSQKLTVIELGLLILITLAALCLSLGTTPNIDEAGY